MGKKLLPTGEEPPKGFESIANNKPAADVVLVDCVIMSQIAGIELAEINRLREKSFTNVVTLTGLTNEYTNLENEADVLPVKHPSDKLIFRAYKNKMLAGYALVIMGWPEPGEWVIQHLVINPDFRLQGIGSQIIAKIEKFAMRSEVSSDRIFAIPLEERGRAFWQNLGYSVEDSRQLIKIENLDHELIFFRKELE